MVGTKSVHGNHYIIIYKYYYTNCIHCFVGFVHDANCPIFVHVSWLVIDCNKRTKYHTLPENKDNRILDNN